ncbi:FkbM family methyltransferase [Paraburkholderia ribeironis]|nr:FkbM family methyltransferase [Paraburkholderia ribeironis]
MLYNTNDTFVGRSLQAYGEWSEPESFLFQQIIREGDVVVEAGANIGSHTVGLSKAVGLAGIVHAFEPQRHTFQLLCANLSLNECFNVFAYPHAVGSENKTISFPVADPTVTNNFGASSLHLTDCPTEAISMRTLDSMNFPRLDLLKVDIEGFEVDMLAGARTTISTCRPVVYLEYMNPYNGDNSKVFVEYFSDLRYDLYYYITPIFNSRNYFGNEVNHFAGLWSFDMLCLPKEKAVVEGMLDARKDVGHCSDPELWRQVKFKYF